MMNAPRSFVAALLLGLGLGACAAAGGNDELYIGLAAPMSSPLGEAVLNGATLAIEEINGGEGIKGRKLALEVKDDRMERGEAIRVAAQFRDEGKVLAVVGHVTSGATIAAADIYNDPKNGLLEISPTATSPELSGIGEWTFRICPTDLHQGSALASWAYTRLRLRRAAVVYVNDEYGRGVLDAFVPAFEKLGGKVVARDPILASLQESETTFDPYLERAQRAEMDALVLIGVGEEVRELLHAARRLGFTGAVMGADGLTDLVGDGAVAEGIYMTAAFLPDLPTEAARTFVRRYTERFGSAPNDRAALAYDAVMLVARGLREVGPSRQALRAYVAGVGTSSAPFEGVSGTIIFDRNGDVVDKDVAVGVVRQGELVTAM